MMSLVVSSSMATSCYLTTSRVMTMPNPKFLQKPGSNCCCYDASDSCVCVCVCATRRARFDDARSFTGVLGIGKVVKVRRAWHTRSLVHISTKMMSILVDKTTRVIEGNYDNGKDFSWLSIFNREWFKPTVDSTADTFKVLCMCAHTKRSLYERTMCCRCQSAFTCQHQK